MNKFKSVLGVFLLAFGLPIMAKEYQYQTVEGDLMNARIYTLDNGLKVYLSVNDEKPRIQTYIAVRTGSRNDPPETTGLAHYLEHLMFKGTRQFGTSDPVGCFFMKQREKIKEAKKKLHTSEQEHEEDEDNEYEEEIMNIVNEGHEQGAIMEGEARMITNIFEFGDKDVTDVMTSRKKIDAIDVNMSVEKALNYMLDEPYSRYPLYEDDIDNIVGVLYLKDVIDAYLNQKEATLSDIAREPFFVHQTMNLSVLFQEMQTKKIHMAIVIDEYSQTEGIVSMEDMLEVIVGNILDEYDVEDRNITKIGWADIYLVRGSTRLEELEDTLGIEFDVEDIETLNGFLIDQLGHLPEDNEEIEIIYQGYSFKSVDIHDNMIRQVKVEKRKRKEEEDVRTQ